VSRQKLAAFASARGSAGSYLAKWPQIMQRVKEERVTVHAWLVDGEPVSFEDGSILVAFKNSIHRETTEKPANRGVIEGVLNSIFGSPTQLVTTLQREWQEVLAESEGTPGGSPEAEELQLVPEGEEPGREPWVDEAVRLFGEELVTIKDD